MGLPAKVDWVGTLSYAYDGKNIWEWNFRKLSQIKTIFLFFAKIFRFYYAISENNEYLIY